LKIAFYSYWYLHYTANLANELVKTNNVFVFVNKNSQEVNNSKDVFDIFNNSIKIIANNYPQNKIKKISWIIKILISIKKNKFDVLHMHESRSILPLWPIKLFFPSLPIIWTLHDVRPHLGEEKYYKNELVLKLNRIMVHEIIVHGEFIKNQLLSECAYIDRWKIHVLHHGALNSYKEKTKECSINIKADYILFFGRMYKYKGLKVVIEAQPIVNNSFPDLKFVIAGRGDDLEEQKYKIKGNDSFIIFDYYLSDNEVNYLFDHTQFIIVPYLEASQSGVIALAFSYGKTVVASNVGSIPEIVDNNHNGLIIPQNNHIELANAIIKLYSNKVLLKRLSTGANNFSQSILSWHSISEMTKTIYYSSMRKK